MPDMVFFLKNDAKKCKTTDKKDCKYVLRLLCIKNAKIMHSMYVFSKTVAAENRILR